MPANIAPPLHPKSTTKIKNAPHPGKNGEQKEENEL